MKTIKNYVQNCSKFVININKKRKSTLLNYKSDENSKKGHNKKDLCESSYVCGFVDLWKTLHSASESLLFSEFPTSSTSPTNTTTTKRPAILKKNKNKQLWLTC